MVGEGVIDNVDVRVGEESFVGSVGAFDFPFTSVGVGFLLRAAGDREELIAFRGF
jgi:hypothetical protein